jgi:hypothetical protein
MNKKRGIIAADVFFLFRVWTREIESSFEPYCPVFLLWWHFTEGDGSCTTCINLFMILWYTIICISQLLVSLIYLLYTEHGLNRSWFVFLRLSYCTSSNVLEYMVSVPSGGALIWAWLGAWAIPLVWERPGQVKYIGCDFMHYVVNNLFN